MGMRRTKRRKMTEMKARLQWQEVMVTRMMTTRARRKRERAKLVAQRASVVPEKIRHTTISLHCTLKHTLHGVALCAVECTVNKIYTVYYSQCVPTELL